MSEVGTWKDVLLFPNGVEPDTVLSGGFTLSRFAKAGYWFPIQVKIQDAVGNERFELFPSGDPSQWTTYTWTVILPPGSAPGTWGLANMTVYDRAENIRQYDFTEIIHFEVESD